MVTEESRAAKKPKELRNVEITGYTDRKENSYSKKSLL